MNIYFFVRPQSKTQRYSICYYETRKSATCILLCCQNLTPTLPTMQQMLIGRLVTAILASMFSPHAEMRNWLKRSGKLPSFLTQI